MHDNRESKLINFGSERKIFHTRLGYIKFTNLLTMLHKMSRNLFIILTVTLCTSIVTQDLKPCLKVESNPDPKQDAISLCNEIVNATTDSLGKITDILCRRNSAQRIQIADAFLGQCRNNSLLNELRVLIGVTSESKNLIEFLLSNQNQIYYAIIYNIINRVWNDNFLIYYMICSLTNAEKTELTKAFPNVPEILSTYSDQENRKEGKVVLMDICLAQRSVEHNATVTDQVVETEVGYFKDKQDGAFKQGVKELFEKYSDYDIRLIFVKYRSVHNADIGDKIMEGVTWNIPYATLARSVENLQMFYAKLLHYFIKENAMCDDFIAINYVITIRTEYDLFNINEEYKKNYNANLIDDLQERYGNNTGYFESIKKLFGDCVAQ